MHKISMSAASNDKQKVAGAVEWHGAQNGRAGFNVQGLDFIRC